MTAEKNRQRYADDPAYRAKRLAQNSAWKAANREQVNAKQRERYVGDPEYRGKRIATTVGWRAANREKVNAKARERYATDPDYRARRQVTAEPRREGWLRRNYGMSLADYDAKLARQHGACAGCGRKFKRPLCVDHCHTTGLLRSLLCPVATSGSAVSATAQR
jgi:hypothetical protein